MRHIMAEAHPLVTRAKTTSTAGPQGGFSSPNMTPLVLNVETGVSAPSTAVAPRNMMQRHYVERDPVRGRGRPYFRNHVLSRETDLHAVISRVMVQSEVALSDHVAAQRDVETQIGVRWLLSPMRRAPVPGRSDCRTAP